MLHPVTSPVFKHFSCSPGSGISRSSSFLAKILGQSTVFGAKKMFFELAKSLLQLLQFIFLFNESKNSKGLQVVTRFRKAPEFVTNLLQTCYNLLQNLLQDCYRVKYIKINCL